MKKILSFVAFLCLSLVVVAATASAAAVNTAADNAAEYSLDKLAGNSKLEKAAYSELLRLDQLAKASGWTVSQEYERDTSAGGVVVTKVRLKSPGWTFNFSVRTEKGSEGYTHTYYQDGKWITKEGVEGLIADPQKYYSKSATTTETSVMAPTTAPTVAPTTAPLDGEDSSKVNDIPENIYALKYLTRKNKLEKKAYASLKEINKLARKCGWTKRTFKHDTEDSSATRCITRVKLIRKKDGITFAFTHAVRKSGKKLYVSWWQNSKKVGKDGVIGLIKNPEKFYN